MLAVPIILFFVSLVFGLLWKRSVLSLLAFTFVIAAGFGIYLGNWSFLSQLSSSLENLIYVAITITGYFVLFILPAVVGAVLGNLLRNSIQKKQ